MINAVFLPTIVLLLYFIYTQICGDVTTYAQDKVGIQILRSRVW